MQKKYNTKTAQMIQQFIDTHENQQFSVNDVVEYMKEQDCSVNLTTIYRNLDKLAVQNRIAKYKISNSDTYQYRIERPDGGCHSHLHLHCRNCGKIFHINCDIMNSIRNDLVSEYGFVLECADSMLSGLCRECANK